MQKYAFSIRGLINTDSSRMASLLGEKTNCFNYSQIGLFSDYDKLPLPTLTVNFYTVDIYAA